MKQLNDFEKKIISELITKTSSEVVLMSAFLDELFFTKKDQRAMIIQTQAKYAVFFMSVENFGNTAKKNIEIQSLLNLLSFLIYLRANGYLTVYQSDATKEEKMFFLNNGFVSPKPSAGKIILNPSGDYTSQPEFIRDDQDKVIYQGVVFKEETYDLIANLLTGVLCVSDGIKELLQPVKTEDKETEIKSSNLHPVITRKTQNYTLKILNLVILAVLCGTIAVAYFKGDLYSKQLSEIQNGQTDVIRFMDSTFQYDLKRTNNVIADESDTEINIAQELYGIDISRWNGDALEEIKPKDSISFVICKATQGTTYQDPDFENNWKTIKKKGWVRGAYHFYLSSEDPIKQAEHFWKVIDAMDSTDIAPIIDIEEESLPAHETVDPVNLQVDLLHFLKHLSDLSGRKPIIYVDLSFANKYLSNSSFAQYPLWLAEYSGAIEPTVPVTWAKKGYKFWQKTDRYSINSHHTDFDVFTGKRSQLYAK